MKQYDNDATLRDVIDVAGYTSATPYDPRIRVLFAPSDEWRELVVTGLDFDGDNNTLDVIVADATDVEMTTCPEHGDQPVVRYGSTGGADPYAVSVLECGHSVACFGPGDGNAIVATPRADI